MRKTFCLSQLVSGFAYSSTQKMEAYLPPKRQALSKLGCVNILVLKYFPDMYIAVIGPAIQYAVTTDTLVENVNPFYLLSRHI